MSRYIDAYALKNKITDLDGGCAIDRTGFDIYTCEVFELIDEVQTADVVEVVRCNDCQNWDRHWISSLFSENTHYCAFIDGPCSGDFYCAAAIKRLVIGGDNLEI